MNTYETVTDKIVALLERGIIPWRRPWSAAGAPRNLVSGRPYRMSNALSAPSGVAKIASA